MPDYFAALHQPRRPWLDSAALKDAFHQATARDHPDIAGDRGEKASALNAAYAALRDPASRLKHLLELEWPAPPLAAATIPSHLADLFGKIAGIRQQGSNLAGKQAAAQSPLARALLAGEGAAHRHELEAALAMLADFETAALAELRALDAAWAPRDEAARARLASVQQQFAYLAKWQAQLREDLFRLDG